MLRRLMLLISILFPVLLFSQDCSEFLKSLKVDPPFNMNSMSKSAACVTGHTYEMIIPLQKGYQYRLVFYASSVFNDDVDFQIIDLNTNKLLVNAPGKLTEGNIPTKNGQTALQNFFDEKTNQSTHPYFDIYPKTTTNIKVVIIVKEKPDMIRGCITVVILDRPFDTGGL